ncbi:MAG: recombinase family protein [Polyangiaceae bacterium]|nr:recombinase family protein [Polyangiaceae bacterium]
MNSRQHVMEGISLQSWNATSSPPARYWAFYVRVTTEESVKKDLSIPNQCNRAIEIAKARGWHDYRIYVEPVNVSAELWTDKRPAFKQMLDDAAAGRIIGICARHTDRLWRNNDVMGKLIGVLRPHGVELWDFNSRYEYKSAHGRFSLQVLGAASELEVGLVSERIREMKRGKALKGKQSGGAPPFGYTSQTHRKAQLIADGYSPDDAYRQACVEYPVGKTWYINEDEAAIVRLIFELYTSHQYRYGCKRIARHLNMAGYHRRLAGPFVHSTVVKILKNPVYAGYQSFDEVAYERRVPSKLPRHKQTLFAGEHPAIIEPNVWHLAQEIRASESKINRIRNSPAGATIEMFSLTGLLKCPLCGGSLHGKWTTRRAIPERNYRYYYCSRRHDGGPEACSFPAIPATPLQDAVWNWLHEILASPEFVMEHFQRMQKGMKAEQPDAMKRLATLQRKRDTLKGAIAKYFKAFEACPNPDAAVLERVRELRAELQNVEGEIVNMESRTPPVERALNPDRVRHYLAQLRERIAARTDYQRAIFQELKRSHDFHIRVSPSGREFTLSLALPREEMVGEKAADKRLMSVLAPPGKKAARQSCREVTGEKSTGCYRPNLARTSRAARSPDSSAPSMYPVHSVAVSVPAQ